MTQPLQPTKPFISGELLYLPGIAAFDYRSPDAAVDPTTLPVQIALIPFGANPTNGDWLTAQWYDTTTARALLGPTGLADPAVGLWAIWLRITGATEQPERCVGALTIT